jgi:hypothetical protein
MQDILKELEHIVAMGYSAYGIFEDWLELMLTALQRNDEEYLKIVHKYRNTAKTSEREIDYFCAAFGRLLVHMKRTNEETLGELYMQWNMANKFRGQFFTPKNIAAMMARMLNPQGRIIDPACGAGILLVEAIKAMDNKKLDASVFYAQDIDLTCVNMCALNLCFFNVNGFVIWGDTYTGEIKKVYRTTRSAIGGSVRLLSPEETEQFGEKHREAVAKTFTQLPSPVSESETRQLHLF